MRIDRRTFSHTVMLGVAGTAVPAWAQARLSLKIGHTGITWPSPSASGARGAPPPVAGPAARGADPGLAPALVQRPVDPAAIEQVVKDISGLGYHGVELFGWQVDGMEAHGGIGTLLEKYRLPLISTYGGPNLTDPAQRKASIERTVATARLVKKYGGKVIVFGPNSVPRDTYTFADHKANIVTALNEGAKAISRSGAGGERLPAADPAPSSEGLRGRRRVSGIRAARAGKSQPRRHPAGKNLDGMVMVELDSGANMPMTALEAATIAKTYLQRQGVSFRS